MTPRDEIEKAARALDYLASCYDPLGLSPHFAQVRSALSRPAPATEAKCGTCGSVDRSDRGARAEWNQATMSHSLMNCRNRWHDAEGDEPATSKSALDMLKDVLPLTAPYGAKCVCDPSADDDHMEGCPRGAPPLPPTAAPPPPSQAEAVREACAKLVDEWAAAYPADVFIPPPDGQHGVTVDACSAKALRAVLPRLAARMRSLPLAPRAGASEGEVIERCARVCEEMAKGESAYGADALLDGASAIRALRPTPPPASEGEAKRRELYEAAARCFIIEHDCPVDDDGPSREWHDEHDAAQREAGQALRGWRAAEAAERAERAAAGVREEGAASESGGRFVTCEQASCSTQGVTRSAGPWRCAIHHQEHPANAHPSHDAGGVGEKGYELTSAPRWINDAANAIMGEVIAATAPDADLSDEEDYASLRGAIEGVIMRAMPHSANDAGGVGEAKAAFYEAAMAYCGVNYLPTYDESRVRLHGAMIDAWGAAARAMAAKGGDDPRRGESGEAIKAQGGTP